MIGASQSLNMNPATAHVEQRAPQAVKGLSAEQRLELVELHQAAKGPGKALECPVAQRDDGYDTVY